MALTDIQPCYPIRTRTILKMSQFTWREEVRSWYARRIISPKDSSTQEEDHLDDLVSKPKKRPATQSTGESEPMAPPAKKARERKEGKGTQAEESCQTKTTGQAKERPEKSRRKRRPRNRGRANRRQLHLRASQDQPQGPLQRESHGQVRIL